MTNNYGDICKAVRKLKRQYGESDPFRLCRAMGILLNFVSLGRDEDAIKGFFINSPLSFSPWYHRSETKSNS